MMRALLFAILASACGGPPPQPRPPPPPEACDRSDHMRLFGSTVDDDPRIAFRSEMTDVTPYMYIDGIAVGEAPRIVALPHREGPYHLELQAEGYNGYEIDVTLRRGYALILTAGNGATVGLWCPLCTEGAPSFDALCRDRPGPLLP